MLNTRAQVYHPCFLMDSVDKHLDFVRVNAARVFIDTFECKDNLLKKITQRYIDTKDIRFLSTLSSIRQSQQAKVEEYYTELMQMLVATDFAGLLNQLYLARGKFYPLEKELIAAMNMMVDGRLLKVKYYGLLNLEIEKANAAKDSTKAAWLNKLKLRIDNEKL